MDRDDIARLSNNLACPKSKGWQASPLVRGKWKELPHDLALRTIISIHDWFGKARPGTISDAWHDVERVRTSPIPCYPNAMLVEFQRSDEDGNCGIASALVHEDGMLLMNGDAAQIHRFNIDSKTLPRLAAADQRKSYLSFFMNWVHGDAGRYQVLYSRKDLTNRLLDPSDVPIEWPITLPRQIRDAELRRQGQYRYDAWVLSGSRLFRVEMCMRPKGLLEMTEDELVASELPVKPEWMEAQFLMTAPSDTERR